MKLSPQTENFFRQEEDAMVWMHNYRKRLLAKCELLGISVTGQDDSLVMHGTPTQLKKLEEWSAFEMKKAIKPLKLVDP